MTTTLFTDRDLGHRFAQILRSAGIAVERHDDHFQPTTPDVEWIAAVARRGWVALTHNGRIRYTPNERDAVMEAGLPLLVVVGRAPLPLLAESLVRTMPRVESFLARHQPPFIAKVYRPSPADLARDPEASGRVEPWFP